MSQLPEDLDELWPRLEAELSERFRVFPDVPLNEGGMPEAEWPRDDIAGFLDLAASIGVSILYADAIVPDDLAEEVAKGLEDTAVGEAEPAAEVQPGSDRIGRIELVFVHEGILHRWEAEADWWSELQAIGNRRDLGEELESDRAESPEADPGQIEEWARLLAEDPGFRRAKTQTGREQQARRLIPEIERSIAESKGSFSSLAWRVVQLAVDVYREEVVPRLDREMAPQAGSLLAQGLRKYQIAARLKISTDRLNRILEQYPNQE